MCLVLRGGKKHPLTEIMEKGIVFVAYQKNNNNNGIKTEQSSAKQIYPCMETSHLFFLTLYMKAFPITMEIKQARYIIRYINSVAQ